MDPHAEEELLRRYRLEALARRKVKDDILNYNFLVAAAYAWIPSTTYNDGGEDLTRRAIDNKDLSADNGLSDTRIQSYKRELQQNEIRSMTPEEVAQFMATAAIEGWSDPIISSVEITLPEHQRPSRRTITSAENNSEAGFQLDFASRVERTAQNFRHMSYDPAHRKPHGSEHACSSDSGIATPVVASLSESRNSCNGKVQPDIPSGKYGSAKVAGARLHS